MVKLGLIGAGKMGISHLAIIGASNNANVVGVADNSNLVTSYLKKYTRFPCYENYLEMLNATNPDAVIVATPTRYHESIVESLIQKDIHVFVEKPFCMDVSNGTRLNDIAVKKNLINQVGYHNRFIGTFKEAARLVRIGMLGNILHFSGNMNGPVVTKIAKGSWRARPEEGGGCLMDYAAHLIDLVHFIIGTIRQINGAVQKKYFSKEVDDGVYALVETENGITGVLNVNWSDETYRKMSTEIAIQGTMGKILVDASELKIYLKNNELDLNYEKGWNVRSLNSLSTAPEYYLRGEEYSLQMENFIESLDSGKSSTINTFSEAIKTDKVIEMIKKFKINDHGQDSIWG